MTTRTTLDHGMFDTLAALYRTFPPDTKVDMQECPMCAAGTLAREKTPDNMKYGEGRQTLVSIIGLEHPDEPGEGKGLGHTTELLKKLGIGDTSGASFIDGGCLSFYKGESTVDHITTTGALADFWSQVSRFIRDPENTPKPIIEEPLE